MAVEPTSIGVAFNRPFKEQVEFFRKKVNLPSSRWDDIFKSAHDRGFIVAGAMKADLLNDLNFAIEKSIAEGKSLQWFRKEFDSIVAKHGWTGWAGEGSKKGKDWRSKLVYQTNMSTSYAAGREKQLSDPDLLIMKPYRRYVHADGVRHPRPHHLSWNGITLPHDDVFWKTHSAPNGWLCRCRIEAASARDYRAAQDVGKAEKPTGWDKVNPKTGEFVGIDKGFGYAPGANANKPLREFVSDKLITFPDAIAKALSADVNRFIETRYPPSEYAVEALKNKQLKPPLFIGFVERFIDIQAITGLDLKGYIVTLPPEAVRHIEKSHGFDGGAQRPPKPEDFDQIINTITQFDELGLGDESRHGGQTVRVTKVIRGEVYVLVFDVLTGKKNRSLQLATMFIKTKK